MLRPVATFDTSTPAVVLKFDPNVLHHGGLGVIRSLGRIGVAVYGVHEQALAPAAYSRYLAGRWLWRPRVGHIDTVLAELRRLADRIGRRAVLLPTDDVGAIFLAEHGPELRDAFLFPAQPRDLPRRVAGKHSMYELCRTTGVACPESALVRGWVRAREFADRVGMPIVVKRAYPSQTKLRSTTVVRTPADLRRRCVDGEELVLQEYIPESSGHDWFFHGYRSSTARCVPAFTGVKERSYPAHAGLTCLGRAVDNVRLRREATSLLATLGYQGVVDLDFRWDSRDGQYKLLDFNPRLGAQFRLFRDGAGVDVALAAYLDLTGQTVAESPIPSGRRFLVENYDPFSALGYWRRGELGWRTWVGSWRSVDETAWLASDDMLPFALMCLWMGWRGMSRPWTKTRRHTGSGSRDAEGVRT